MLHNKSTALVGHFRRTASQAEIYPKNKNGFNQNCHAEFNSASRRLNKGFTLVELMAAIMIFIVLMTVVWPLYQKAIERSVATEGKTWLEHISRAEQLVFMQDGDYVLDFSKLDIDLDGGFE